MRWFICCINVKANARNTEHINNSLDDLLIHTYKLASINDQRSLNGLDTC